MLQLKKFVFNAFQVNTYLLYDETGECVIVDAACADEHEETELSSYISAHKLKPVMLISTHTHVDHILGNSFVHDNYNLELAAHPDSLSYLHNAIEHASSFGLKLNAVIKPGILLTEGQEIHFGNNSLRVLETPGHANGSLCFYNKENGFVIAGDVLFFQSIGRTDLPGGDYDLIKNSIWSKLFVLPDDTIVYPGHGPETTIGNEKISNPFVAIG